MEKDSPRKQKFNFFERLSGMHHGNRTNEMEISGPILQDGDLYWLSDLLGKWELQQRNSS